MKNISPVIIMIVMYHISWGQDTTINSSLQGNWEFGSAKSDSKNCEAPKSFPIKKIHLEEDTFTLIGLNDTVTGNYDFMKNELRMFNAIKNGVPKSNEQSLIVESVKEDQLIIEFPTECGLLKLEFQKIK